MPCIWNDEQASEAQKAQLLLDIKARQSPGVVRMLDALRTCRVGYLVALLQVL